MLQRAFSVQVVRAFAPALVAGMHTSTAIQARAAALSFSDSDRGQAASTLQGLLGLSSAEAHAVLDLHPDIAHEKPSVLLERIQFLGCALGISPTRLRSLVLEKPALLSDLSVRELRSIAGLSGE